MGGTTINRNKVGGEVGHGALIPNPFRCHREGAAIGGVDHEVGLFDIDLDRAHPDRNATDDPGDGFGVGDHVGVKRVDVKGDADHDCAIVIGTGEGRSDCHK